MDRRWTTSGMHGEEVTCCAFRGNADHIISGAGPVDVSDLTYLMAYLFIGGTYPPCPEEGNVDGLAPSDIPINAADLTYLVEYLFDGGPPPPACT